MYTPTQFEFLSIRCGILFMPLTRCDACDIAAETCDEGFRQLGLEDIPEKLRSSVPEAATFNELITKRYALVLPTDVEP